MPLRYVEQAFVPLSVRPTGLADGLARKEPRLAGRKRPAIRPRDLVPPFATAGAAIRQSRGTVQKRSADPTAGSGTVGRPCRDLRMEVRPSERGRLDHALGLERLSIWRIGGGDRGLT